MALFFRIFRHLLPDARAWRIRWYEPGEIANARAIDRFFIALAEVFAAVREFCDLAYLDLFPATTRLIERHQQQFALRSLSTEQAERDAIAAAWAATGGQSPSYLQGVLQASGFSVFVHEWWGSGTLPRLLGDLLEAWWVFDTADVTLVTAEVDSVADRSGNAHPLEAADADARLAYVASAGPGSARPVGRAGDIANDTLVAAGFDFATGDRPCIAFVARLYDLPGGDLSLLGLDGPGGSYFRLRYSSGDFAFTVGYDGGTSSVTGPAADTDWHLFEFYLLSTGWIFAVDGIEFTSVRTEGVGANADGGPDTFVAPYVGAALELREVALLNDEPNAEQRAALRNLFALKYRPLAIDVTPRDPREYTTVPLVGTVQCGEALALCGEPTALCNAFLANEPGYLVNQAGTPNAPPGIPYDPDFWPYFIYVGAARFPDHASLDVSRRGEFEELVLRLMPDQHWLVLLIDWTGETIDTEGFIPIELEDESEEFFTEAGG